MRNEEFGARNPEIRIPQSTFRNSSRLARRLAERVAGRLALVCIGNELSGDDAAGPAVARRLAGTVPWPVHSVHTAPENFLLKIAADRPDTVVLIDAIDFAAEPGTIELLEPGAIGGSAPSTHGPGPGPFLEALGLLCPCRCVVLGIQPARAAPAAPLSPPVAAAVNGVVRAFRLLAGRPGRD